MCEISRFILLLLLQSIFALYALKNNSTKVNSWGYYEAKAAYTSQKNITLIYFFPLPANQGLSACNGYLGRQMTKPRMFPLCHFLELLLLSTSSYGIGYPFGQIRTAVLGVCPPCFLPSLSLLAGGRQSEENSESVAQTQSKYWFVINSVLVTNPKNIIIQAMMDSTPTRPSTAYQDRRSRTWRIQQRVAPPLAFVLLLKRIVLLISQDIHINIWCSSLTENEWMLYADFCGKTSWLQSSESFLQYQMSHLFFWRMVIP